MIFKIETNKNFKKHKINKQDENIIKKKIYNNFILSKKVKSIYSINKNSSTSKIYEIVEDNNIKKILRSSNISDFNKTNWAAKKINTLSGNYFFSLIKTANNKYIHRYKKKIYLLYYRVPGKIYSGKILEFYNILQKAISLHDNFNNKNKFKSKKIKNNFKNFKEFIMQDNLLISSIIKKETNELLQKNKRFILNQMKEIKNKKTFNDIQVVHSDIHHANVIINKSGVTFLDIEDIRLDSLGVALSFLIFKLARHSIYKNKISLKKFKNYIFNKILNILKENNIKLNKKKIIQNSFYKTLSDLELIISQIKNKNFDNFYDLEKKLHNLVEIRYMFDDEYKI